MVYTGCPSGSELRVVHRDSGGCAVPSVREVWFCVDYAAWVACLPFGIYGTLNPLEGQYFGVISPLDISGFSGFSFKNKCGE